MHVERIRNRNGVITTLVRESYRDDGKVRKRTVANITHLPEEIQLSIARQLKGETQLPASAFEVVGSRGHGHVQAVIETMKRLDFDRILGPGKGRQRELVKALVTARILEPASKLATASALENSTLAETLGIRGTTEDALYEAMDWLVERQPTIEKRLAKRHLEPCGLVLYDLTSSYVEGTECPLATRGYSRDGKPHKLQVNFGIITDEMGRPIAVDVYEGRTADPATVKDQITKVRSAFGLEQVVFVGDRGMLAQTVINDFRDYEGFEWITALKSGSLRKLRAEGDLQLGLFDERNIFEFTSDLYPDERLVACRNPALAKRRAEKRREMLEATKDELHKVRQAVEDGRLFDGGKIGVRVGRVINKYKMAKHFKLDIGDGRLAFEIDNESVREESSLDGLYVIRTSVPADTIDRDDVVRCYKRLTKVERDFRSMKASGLEVRPIFHRTEPRVRAHIFLCMLAQYVQWHMRHAWRELLFAEEMDATDTRDPVAPARPSPAVTKKKARKKTEDGLPVQSFKGLLRKLATITKNICRMPSGETFEQTTRADALQTRAFELLKAL